MAKITRIITTTIITRQGTPCLICGGRSCFFLNALYFAIHYSVKRKSPVATLLNVNRRRRTSSLLFATTLLAASAVSCSRGEPRKPDLPASISPGWSLKQMDVSSPPARLPQSGTPPVCWKADYTSSADRGNATVIACGYRASAGALDAAQRMTPAPGEVRFQKGVYFVVVGWNGVSQAGITTLVSAIERALPSE